MVMEDGGVTHFKL